MLKWRLLPAVAVFPVLLSAQQRGPMPSPAGAAPGFVLESWTTRDGLPVNTISRVMQSKSGYIWLATFDGLVRFDGIRFTTFTTGNSEGLPSNRIVDIVESDGGALLLTTELNQSVRLQNGKFTPLKRTRGALSAPPPRPFTAQAPNGRKWSSDGNEIRLDGRLAYRTPDGTGNALSITSIAVDHEGSLWFGTTARGLHQLKAAVFTVYGVNEGLSDNNLYSVTSSESGGVWAGGWGTTVGRIEDGRMTVFGPEHGIRVGAISILEDSKRHLWLGDTRCDLPAMRCRRDPSSPINGVVHAIHEDLDGTLWFGTNVGLFLLRDDAWIRADTTAGAPRNTVRGFLRTADGALWMATNGGGLARFQGDKFTSITTANGLPSDLIRALYQDADGWLWIGTEGRGLARLDPLEWNTPGAHGRTVNIRATDGLFDDGVHVILEDAGKRLWMSTNRGIFWVSRAELNAFADQRIVRVRSTGYTERNGLRNREANGGSQPAGSRSSDGRLWFATQDGLAMADPASISGNRIRPHVLIERVIAGGTRADGGSDGIEITPARRDLQIEYTALSFLAPENVRFRYRLVPYDKAWVDADTRRSAVYTRVPPGRYTFEVIASNAEDVWSEKAATLELRVVPRFFETGTFRLLVLLALTLLVWAGVRWRISRLRSLANELQQRVDDRTRDLREREALLSEQNTQLARQADQLQELDRAKSRFFANVSHELRTPLTLTIGPLEDAREQLTDTGSRDAVSRIDMALRSARRLFRLVNQILDVSKLEAGGMKLHARPGDLTAFVRGIASAFSAVAERKRITLRVESPKETPDVWFDPDALEKVIANLLSNAFKFTPDRGGILVRIDDGDGDSVVRVSVGDSGPGIPPEHLPHIFERFYQVDDTNTRAQPGTGIGLSLARELAELHGGTLEVESGSGGGATFVLSLRTGRSHLRDDQIVEAEDTTRSTSIIAESVADDAGIDLGSRNGEASSASHGVTHSPTDDVTTLLVVDDNADLRAYVRSRFDSRYRIVEAADGADAIRRAREITPDLVISDVMMPGTDGHALCAALRASPETDFIPVILLTAQAEPEQRIAGLGRGADDYIVKPFDMRELEARVENLIASRRLLRKRFAGRHVELNASAEAVSTADTEFVNRVRSAVEANLTNPDFGVSELAVAVFQERSYLFRRTREVFGETPSDLLRRLRLERSIVILEDGEGSIAEVAYGAGFNSVSHFCRTFRTAYGVTPSAWREKSRSVV